MNTPLPVGFDVAIDPDVKQLDDSTLFGGDPARVLRLSTAGARAWQELKHGAVRSTAGGLLARRLTDTGLAHPRPSTSVADVTVLIPVRDRVTLLDRCLTALDGTSPVVVVDDGSTRAAEVASVARRHGATLLRRQTSGGPGPARDTGLAKIVSEFVAFLDSDCQPSPDWVERLAGHFADPLVGAVAARIVAADSNTPVGAYSVAYGSLDLGAREARVVPGSRVAYLPTAALIVRRAALQAVAREGCAFDPALRYGEDVDLVWRLHEAGWRVRYDPSVRVAHHEPDTWPQLLARRFRYGTSAAPLAQRHPRAVPPLVLHAGPTAAVVALLARRPAVAAGVFALQSGTLALTLRRAQISRAGVLRASVRAVAQTWVGIGRYTTQFGAPVVLAALASPGRRHWGGWAAVASLLLAPACTAPRSPLPITTRVLGRFADDMAYGAGVLVGCLHQRTLRPLVPAMSWRWLRANPVTSEGQAS